MPARGQIFTFHVLLYTVVISPARASRPLRIKRVRTLNRNPVQLQVFIALRVGVGAQCTYVPCIESVRRCCALCGEAVLHPRLSFAFARTSKRVRRAHISGQPLAHCRPRCSPLLHQLPARFSASGSATLSSRRTAPNGEKAQPFSFLHGRRLWLRGSGRGYRVVLRERRQAPTRLGRP